MAMNNEQDKYFNRGFGLAVSMLTRESGDYDLAKKLLIDSGISIDDFKESEIDNFDMKEIKKAFSGGK